jgi:Zn-dependent M28 family amino/carboxypeptidase
VLFLAVTAEEQGLLGSAHYAANPLHPLADTVAGLNMDGLNVIGLTRDVSVIGYGFNELDLVIDAAASEQGRVLAPDREAEKGSYFRSDHFELAKLGVPMLYPSYGYDHVEKGINYGMAASQDYTANRYHRISDEYSDDWVVAGAIQDLKLYFRVGQMLADGNSWPNWNEGSEFKAKRDAQRADK